MYMKGVALPQNDSAAFHWYGKSAEQGFAPAQALMAIFYIDGRGVEKDLNAAARWLRKAAEQGEPVAQARYGLALALGEGVKRDPIEAWAWLSLSTDERSVQWRDKLTQAFTPKQRVRAEARLVELRKELEKSKS